MEINEAIAGELPERAVAPLESLLIRQIAQLGVETDATVSVALKSAHWIAFCMRAGRTPRDEAELAAESRELLGEDPAQVAALAVAWWDGILTALRARDLERRRGSS